MVFLYVGAKRLTWGTLGDTMIKSSILRFVIGAAVVVVAAFCGWVAFMELFVAGFRPVVVAQGVGRPMVAGEVTRHAAVGVAFFVLAGGSAWWAVMFVRGATIGRVV